MEFPLEKYQGDLKFYCEACNSPLPLVYQKLDIIYIYPCRKCADMCFNDGYSIGEGSNNG
jgi:hypothetical protein